MFKRWGLSAAAMVLAAAMILPGCGSKEEPKEALKGAVGKVSAMTSYEMKSKMVLNNVTIDENTASDPTAAQVLSMLKNAEITVDGVYQAEPLQTEATLVLNLKGDMAMSFTIPMVMTKEKMYIKVPSIPFFPLPETVVGKFLELDLKELAEQEGAEFNPEALDTQKAQKLGNEMMAAVLDEYDQDKYFEEISPKDAGLPEGVGAKQVVRFAITNDNVKEAATIFVNNVLPKIMDIVSKDEYKDMLEIDPQEIADAKAELQSEESKAEVNEGISKLDQYLTVNTFHLDTAVNKDDFPVYQALNMDIKVTEPEEGVNVGISMTASNQYMNINKKPEFKIGIPTGDAVITLEELQNEFGGAMGTY